MGAALYNGIVLSYANYRESDRILTLFTREAGLLSVCARGCRRPKSPLLLAGEPFVYGEFQLFERAGKYNVDAFTLLESFYPIREDLARLAGGAAMLRLVKCSGLTEGAQGLFSCLYYALSYLAYAPVEPLDITICFFVRALRELGMQPLLTRCAACGTDLRAQKKLFFSSRRGGAVCPACAFGDEEVDALSLEALRRMLLLRDADMQKVRLPASVRGQLKKIIRSFAAEVLEHDFKSFEQI